MSIIYINPYSFPAAASSFLLDAYPGAAAAYSLRNLSSSVTNVVRVRRSSDNAEDDFTAAEVSDGTLTSWVGAGNNGFVRTWYDQSGNGNDAGNAVNQPQIVAGGAVNELNGKPCITFNTNGTSTLVLGTRLTNVRSVFEVLNINATQLTALNFLVGDTTNYDYHGGGSTWLSPSDAAAVVRNGSNRINNSIENLTTTNRVSSQVLISMIHTGNAAAGRITEDRTLSGRSIRGNMQELIIYTTDQTANVASINGNINAHYTIY